MTASAARIYIARWSRLTRLTRRPLKDAYGYATVILEHSQSYRNDLKSIGQSRDTQDLVPVGQAMSQAGVAYQSLRAALQPIAGLDSVAASFQRFQSELKWLQKATATQ